MAGLLKLLNSKHLNPSVDPTTSLSGKTVIITGANTGLGYEAAIKFTRLRASKIILGVRNLEKGNAAKSSIQKLLHGPEGVIEVWPLDMSSYPSIRAFVEQCKDLKAIDIVVLNAGVMMKDFEQSQYGWETTLQVNTLSTTLLALLLLPKLKALKKTDEQAPVLEFVSSDLYRNVVMPGEDESKPLDIESYSFDTPMQSYNTDINFSGRKQYARSKFFLQCAISSISKIAGHEKDFDVLVTSVSPGLCASDLGRAFAPTNPVLQFLFFLIKFIFVKTGEQGARSIVSGALTKAGEGVQGGYWKDDKWQKLADNLTSPKGKDMIQHVWVEIVGALKEEVPEVLEIIDRHTVSSAKEPQEWMEAEKAVIEWHNKQEHTVYVDPVGYKPEFSKPVDSFKRLQGL